MEEQTYAAPLGESTVEVEHSTQGIRLRLRVSRPREPGETQQQAGDASLSEAMRLYLAARDLLAAHGAAPGPFRKPDAKP